MTRDQEQLKLKSLEKRRKVAGPYRTIKGPAAVSVPDYVKFQSYLKTSQTRTVSVPVYVKFQSIIS